MSLRSAFKVPARMAATTAIPFLLRVKGSRELGEVCRMIDMARVKSFAPWVDEERFPSGQPETFATDTLRLLCFLRSNERLLEETMRLFADEASRQLLRRILVYRALGPRHVRLPSDGDNPICLQQNARHQLLSPEKLEPLETQMFDVHGTVIEAWLLNIWADFHEKQYFFDRDNCRIAVSENDVVIDGGACFGDTALAFSMAVGAEGHVHAFEPMPSQASVISRNLKRNPTLSKRISHHAIALSDRDDTTILFADGGAGACASENGTVEVRTRTLDSFAAEHQIRPSFIKLDVEGAEGAVLRGAATVIRTYRPKLAVSAYHSMSDLLGLAPLIHSIEPSYRFYLDHHTTHHEETVLYCVCD